MNRSLREFMASLVDYAGLFPPAGLGMAEAVAEYARWLGDPSAWMLGRFIVPAQRLPELDGVLATSGFTGTWRYSVLAGSRDGADACLDALAAQGRLARDFEDRQAGSAGIETLEIPLPQEACAEEAALNAFLERLREKLEAADFDARTAYLEIPAATDADLVAGVLAGHAVDPEGGLRLALKLRTGGVTPEAFPSCAQVAGVLSACARAGVALKCTAGLHHPVRHEAREPQVMMHGFFNVFGAGMLARAGLADADLVACVEETDPDAFTFADDHFAWRGHEISSDTVAALRRDALHGFGSCSFAEPVTDLQNLGLL